MTYADELEQVADKLTAESSDTDYAAELFQSETCIYMYDRITGEYLGTYEPVW